MPGEGNPDADMFFIGEGPGADEDEQGRPFVGRSGKLLTEMLHQIGIERSEVFIGNVVKCRPPDNRKPEAEEMLACRHYLQAQLALIKPKVIVTLGGVALAAFFGTGQTLSKVIGKFVLRHGQLFFPVWHPSYVLRAQSQRKEYLRHFKRLKKLVDRGFVLPSGESG